MVHIQGVFTKDGQGKLLVSDGTAAASTNHALFSKEVGEIASATMEFQYTHDEFETLLVENAPYLFDSKKAVERACEENNIQKVIGWLDDAEDECRKFLTGKGYAVYADKETAVEELEFEVLAAKVGKTEINANVAPDVWEKVTELSAKHGWLHVLNLLEA
jgi:hypothetical protein